MFMNGVGETDSKAGERDQEATNAGEGDSLAVRDKSRGQRRVRLADRRVVGEG
jgi:hypothetical protein